MLRLQNIPIAVFILFSSSLVGQSEFAKLPAKVKSKMAVEEDLASERDEAFQSMMMKGMEHFELREYKEALAAFQKAEEKRPLNVYPPVMIEDVRLSMRLLAEEEAERAKQDEAIKEPIPEKPKEPELTADERVALMYEAEMRKVRGDMPPPPPEPEPEKEMDEPVRDKEGLIISDEDVKALDDTSSKSPMTEEQLKVETTEVQETVKEVDMDEPVSNLDLDPLLDSKEALESPQAKDTTAELEDGITERSFMEGNKEITECVVTERGISHTYRRVIHAWGGKFYFKDGESITQRVWDEEVGR